MIRWKLAKETNWQSTRKIWHDGLQGNSDTNGTRNPNQRRRKCNWCALSWVDWIPYLYFHSVTSRHHFCYILFKQISRQANKYYVDIIEKGVKIFKINVAQMPDIWSQDKHIRRYTDADWASNIDWKSVSGCAIFHNNNLNRGSRRSNKQLPCQLQRQSTWQQQWPHTAEFVYLKGIFSNFGYSATTSHLHVDNQSVLEMIECNENSKRTKHIIPFY